jgi:FixJ family two-component response regulator
MSDSSAIRFGRQSQPGVAEPPLPIRVLVVDDEEDQFVLVRRLLAPFTSPRFEVEWADSFASGLAALGRRAHDVCLVDYRLGLTDGVGLIWEAKDAGSKLPFILVTGQGDRDVDMQAMAAGAIDYLSKTTLDGPTLERAIRYATTQQALLDTVQREADRRRALDEVTKALSLTGPSRDGLDRVLGVTDERLGYGCSAFYLLAGDRISLGAARGFVDPIATLAVESGPLHRAMAEGHALIVPNWTETAGALVHSQYVIPLSFESRAVGLFTVAVSEEQPVDDPDQAVLLEIGSRVGSAIGLHQERTWLAERRLLLRRTSEFTRASLREPSGSDYLDRILARLQVAFSADGFALAMAHDDDDLVIRSAVGSLADRLGRSIGEAHTVAARARERRVVLIDSSGTSCAAFVPVVDEDQLAGLLWVDRRGFEAEYSAHETDALAALGNEVGVVLSVARERALVTGSGVRDEWTGVYKRAFLDGLLASYPEMAGSETGLFGMVLVGPRDPDRLSVKAGHQILDACSRAAAAQVKGGPAVIAVYEPATLAVLVRERTPGHTAALANDLAEAAGSAGEVELAVGWAMRSPGELVELAEAAELALELSRRTGADLVR